MKNRLIASKVGLAVLFFTADWTSAKTMEHFNEHRILASVIAGQDDIIKGQIKDEKGNPIKDVRIQNKTKGIIAHSDAMGEYIIVASEGDVLEFFKDDKVFHTVKVGDKKVLDFTFPLNNEGQEREKGIQEVVITGYQRVEANKSAGSYNVVDMKSFERRGNSDIVSNLEGLSPSLVLSTNPSDPSGSKELTIRGVSTLAGSSSPLIVVDGFQYEGDLKSINPYEVENITLLKDAAAASIYGAKAANGVIVVTTKKGKSGKTQIRYTNNLTFSSKADLGYAMNRVGSSSLVDIQEQSALEAYNTGVIINYRYRRENNMSSASNVAYANNRVYSLYSDLYYGYITQDAMNAELAVLRNTDNTNDLRKTYLQSPFINQQNISVMGGNEDFRYRSSLNYTDEYGNIKNTKNNRILFDFVSDLKFTPKFNLEFQSNLTLNNNENTPLQYGESSPNSLSRAFAISSYERFYDAENNPIAVRIPYFNRSSNNGGMYGGKDPYEIQRLISLGLLDETYYPAQDFGRYSYTDKNWSMRVQAMLNYKMTNWLTARFGGQLQKTAGTIRNLAEANSWYMYHLINNTTPMPYTQDRSTLNIPYGARLQESRFDSYVYLMRGQLDFAKDFGQHNISGIVGSEIQDVKSTYTNTDRFGYDTRSNIFLPVNNYNLTQQLTNVAIPLGIISGGIPMDEGFGETQNRFFSLYGNIQYGYANKYILTGSARIDQSNLFGTDPQYRYKPFWSVGAKWRVGKEEFLKEKDWTLDMRVSYGFNGNIANLYGPFDIARKSYVVRAQNAMGLQIESYKIPNLRWEQTATTNVGLDTRLFSKRVNMSLDYYHKNTTDVLSEVEEDPTRGSAYIARNDANIVNKGFEITLNSNNILKENFTWNTQFNFRINTGIVKKAFFNPDGYGAHFFTGRRLNLENNTPNSLFVFDYAGVSSNGNGQIRRANGDIVEIDTNVNPAIFTMEDLKSAGPTLPKYVAGLNNSFTYKNVTLSFLLVYQGGHKLLKDSYDGEFLGRNIYMVNADAARAWQAAGDEATTDIPAISSTNYSHIIRGSSKNVIDGDFIRLRDVILSYTIPSHFLEDFRMKELTLNLRAGNFWLWTKNKEGIDPETQGLGVRTFSVQKTFTIGATLTF